jgi:hypothetical protein
MMKADDSSEAPGDDEAVNGSAAREARHFEIDVGEVEIGEDEAAGKHNRAKDAAYLRHRALIDVVLERGERLLEAHLQARDDRLVEAVASRLRLSSVATAPCPPPAAAEPLVSLSTDGQGKPSALLSSQQSDSVRPSATAIYAASMRRRRNPEGAPKEAASAREAQGPGQVAIFQRRVMSACSAAGVGDGADGSGDMLTRDDAFQAIMPPMPPRRRRQLGKLRVVGAVVAAVAGGSSGTGGSCGAGAAELRCTSEPP